MRRGLRSLSKHRFVRLLTRKDWLTDAIGFDISNSERLTLTSSRPDMQLGKQYFASVCPRFGNQAAKWLGRTDILGPARLLISQKPKICLLVEYQYWARSMFYNLLFSRADFGGPFPSDLCLYLSVQVQLPKFNLSYPWKREKATELILKSGTNAAALSASL
jgi:hypothetical protein